MSTTFEHDFVISPPAATPRSALSGAASAALHQAPVSPPSDARAGTTHPQTNRMVVLVAPEFLEPGCAAELVRSTFRSARGDARILLRVCSAAGLNLAADLAEAGLIVDALVAPDIVPDDELPQSVAASAVFMPPGSTLEELNDFALALSDVVLTGPHWFTDPDLVNIAREQKKPVISAGDGLPPLPLRHPDIAGWLHTRRAHWRYCLCHASGRLEQFCLELFAYNWRGKAKGGHKHSRQQLRRCVSGGWPERWPPYFAPEDPEHDEQNWRKLAPDTAARHDAALIVDRFNSLDHSALFGAFAHRDLIWLAYFASAFAVFAAVMGSLPYFESGLAWPSMELFTLFGILAIILALRWTQLQDHWTSCRLAAEQLRIVRLCLPLFVVPSVLRGADKLPPGAAVYTVRALEEVKRTVRDQGVPRPRRSFSPAEAAAWLELLVEDQALYHETNELRLEHAEIRLHNWAAGLFLLAVLAVVAHYFSKLPWIAPVVPWLLILTAAGPAAAAALHGVRTRLGIVHRIALSRDTKAELDQIHTRLKQFKLNLPNLPSERAWSEIRSLALRASNAMGSENTSWHNLVRREKDDIM
jgi:hypothetical protein